MIISVIVFVALCLALLIFAFFRVCIKNRHENVVRSLENYNASVLGYSPVSLDENLRIVVEKPDEVSISLDELKKNYKIKEMSLYSLYTLNYADVTVGYSSTDECRSLCDDLFANNVSSIILTLSDGSKFVTCSSDREFNDTSLLLYYDASSMLDDQSDSFLKALQSSLYFKEYKVFTFSEDKWLYVTPDLGEVYTNLECEDYYYNMCLVRLLSDMEASTPFTTLYNSYQLIIDRCIDYT